MLIEKDNIIDSHNASMLIDKTDKHHLDLISNTEVDAFDLNTLYGENTNNSKILTYVNKVYELFAHGFFDVKTNRFLKYFPQIN